MTQSLLLGEFPLEFDQIPIDSFVSSWSSADFLEKSIIEQKVEVSAALLSLIQKAPPRCFLLPGCIKAIRTIRSSVIPNYTFFDFEYYLIHQSGLLLEEERVVRGKICGKYVPREAFQTIFPIGFGKIFDGPHFVTGHAAPDLDTTVASFWGFLDAFAAKIGSGGHIWNLPEAAPSELVEVKLLFEQYFGADVFDIMLATFSSLSIRASMLCSKQGMITKQLDEPQITTAAHREKNAVVLMGPCGEYVGDWRSFDIDEVRSVTSILSAIFAGYVAMIQHLIITLFANQQVTKKQVQHVIEECLSCKIGMLAPYQHATIKEQNHVQMTIKAVFNITGGVEASCLEVMKTIAIHHKEGVERFQKKLHQLLQNSNFNDQGILIESTANVFAKLKEAVTALDDITIHVQAHMSTLGIAFAIKKEVFGHTPSPISDHAMLEELRQSMGSYPSLTVVTIDQHKRAYPIGVVFAADLQKNILGTVSLRDFCNREEVGIPSYLEIISVVDHHKATLQTASPLTVNITDAQSSNVAMAELAFGINDAYGTQGQTIQSIDHQLQQAQEKDLLHTQNLEKMGRLLRRKLATIHAKDRYFVDPRREYLEYMHFVLAILDDTDLLAKATPKDIWLLVSLINRMKTIVAGVETVAIVIDPAIADDPHFVKKAAKLLMQHQELYSIYAKVYAAKEAMVDAHLEKAAKGKPSVIFDDAKVLAGVTRVSQTKVFKSNITQLSAVHDMLVENWIKMSQEFYEKHKAVDLYLHMISTVNAAQELYEGSSEKYTHNDELWIWIPKSESALQHLHYFLSGIKKEFKDCATLVWCEVSAPFDEIAAGVFEEILNARPRNVLHTTKERVAIIHFPASLLNSRKSKIAPYLPIVRS